MAAPRVTVRDLAILDAVGRFRMLSRSQLKRWLLPDVSEPVVTRLLERLRDHGWLGVERIHGNGIQVGWLTKKGAELLVERGHPTADLFPATGPAAAKDFAHTLAIGDVASSLATRPPMPDELLPAWRLQRLFSGKLAAIPDLLVLWRANAGRTNAALAVEVDLGSEAVATVFAPKLRLLSEVLTNWFSPQIASILVVVPSGRRADSVRKETVGLEIPVLVERVSAFS